MARGAISAPAFYRLVGNVPVMPWWFMAASRNGCRPAAGPSDSGVGQPLAGQFNPGGAAKENEVVGDVVAAVVRQAGPHAVALIAMVAAAVSDPDVAARFVLQHEGEVFRTH